MVEWEKVDIRLAIGEPSGETPIKLTCKVHPSRLGTPDDKGSLSVYRTNVHCFGCGFHLKRRYASLAFLLGEWDGMSDEDGEEARAAVNRIACRLEEFVGEGKHKRDGAFVPPPPTHIEVEAFHQFLLSYGQARMKSELMEKRGLALETIKEYRIGYTGTHFTIPIYDQEGKIASIRYRADDDFLDVNDPNYRKYEGTWKRNAPTLFPYHVIQGQKEIDTLWIVEGEFDAIAGNQAGCTTITMTNGASNLHKLVPLVLNSGTFVNRWVLATDQDAAGHQAADQVWDVLVDLGQTVARAYWGGAKDLCAFYAQGRNKKEFRYEDRTGLLHKVG